MIKLRGAAFGFAVLILVAACAGAAPSSAGSSGLPSQDSSAPDASVPLAADSVATYRAYIEQNADLLVQRTRPFVDAVVAGKIAQGQLIEGDLEYMIYPPDKEPTATELIIQQAEVMAEAT